MLNHWPSAKTSIARAPTPFLAVRCRRCGLVYLNPPTPAGEFELECTPLLGRHGVREMIDSPERRDSGSGPSSSSRRSKDLDQPRDAYDAVLLTDVLERMDHPLSTLKATRQLLHPNGIALLNHSHPIRRSGSLQGLSGQTLERIRLPATSEPLLCRSGGAGGRDGRPRGRLHPDGRRARHLGAVGAEHAG